ncbi:Glycosyl transferase family 2 [Algoriphagus alkaliphilus]|uniref:Glycosyl transferase family 2 n=1 Tax=Algoriphagus alkaliphilus TaxID=279824 RepID=A0A1G5ZNH8_9BACT|nr:glycosyltransferase [Algoriphagus alkaliphilus]SDA96361.1 Glycosyl transferase family 2 [Algoriphagus alkaliphilus]
MSSQIPLVSVCMITFNQAEFIQRSIEGILMQNVDFDFQLLIANDASPDCTEELVNKYIHDYPKGNRIKYIRHSKNFGMMANFIFALKECNGKYIALCEGDDYWTDPYKLQKQVDFLEANSDFVLCYHPVNVLFPDGQIDEDYHVKGIIDKSESNIYDLAAIGNYIHTPSVVFRNLLNTYPDSFNETPIGDYFLWMLLAQHGKIKKLPDVMAIYRHGVGVHSTQNDDMRSDSFIKTLDVLSKTISDKTIVKILRNRILAIKSASLPYPVRALKNYRDLTKAEILKDYVDFGQLVKAIWLKIRRKF